MTQTTERTTPLPAARVPAAAAPPAGGGDDAGAPDDGALGDGAEPDPLADFFGRVPIAGVPFPSGGNLEPDLSELPEDARDLADALSADGDE